MSWHTAEWWRERQKSYPLSEWALPVRGFTDKELKAKAKRWKKEIDRAIQGKPGRFDSLPGNEMEVRELASKLFYPADALVLLSELFPPKKTLQGLGFFN